ncbi:hypothetical protein VTP01DRAFT_7041 [Rhizomucor pusillus]|uniref:uncharacterized protein n=1 Tax=Rhizomucor pusillus TaxID=4840 RepID=UPI0037420AB6
MVNNDLEGLRVIKKELEQAVLICSDRCLYQSTKWAAEILDGIHPDALDHEEHFTHIAENMQNMLPLYESTLPPQSEVEYNKYQYAKALFQMRQYDNAAFILSKFDTPKSRFLRLYSKYLAGEKRKEEETQDILSTSEEMLAENAELDSIYAELSVASRNKELDAFCMYLYGIVLRKRGEEEEAARVLLDSVKAYEFNWSAWMELGQIVKTKKAFHDLRKVLDQILPQSLVKDAFLAYVALEVYLPQEQFWPLLDRLKYYFPNSVYVKSQIATAHYDLRDYPHAEAIFEEIRAENPYRLEDMDKYSNLIYVQERSDKHMKLSILAHQCERIDKYRPETCCIIGNYYSAIRNVAESIAYFRRALKLNRNYHLAWTLLGHDYIELKNPNAAIECYRRAINVNTRDYRAWYGIGQAYEILNLQQYGLYYYLKATELRPYDARMWSAVADCLKSQNRDNERIAYYLRAASFDFPDRHKVYERLGKELDGMEKRDDAAFFYRLAYDVYVEEGTPAEDYAEVALYLAEYHADKCQWREAERFARNLMENGVGTRQEEAKALVEDIRIRAARLGHPVPD